VQRSAEADQLGMVHQKFGQFYQGIPVEHASYSIHSKGGVIESISGDFERITNLNTTPSLSDQAALSRALASVGARTYMWQTTEANAASFLPTGSLVIVRDHRVENGPQVLAWKFNIYAAAPISRAYVYVNAHNGEVVLTDNIIKHAAATATFATAYSGTRNLADGTTSGGYFLQETTRGNGIQTFNCKKGNSYTAATNFIDADNNWTAAEYNNANFDNVAGDAHLGAQCTYDYWKAIHGRNSYDNAGAAIKSYVHFDDTPGDGVGYENAYWDGTEMTYGDGASRFRPLTAMDVCGHEIGHAVCERTANLTYSNESGAMNEGLSDIWGASIEDYAVNTLGVISGGPKAKSTWLIGEEIDKQQAALRSMSAPKTLGQPAYYKGTNWYTGSADNGGVHTNSGVLNHWYYVLAAGESGTNEGGGSYSVTGVGLNAAAKITFRMESVYMTASSTYAQARTGAIQAATDLFGAGSAQVIATTNAWFSVGVGAAYSGGGGTPPPGSYCTSSSNSVAYEYIDLVQLGSINRTSGADGGYYNGTASSTSIAQGSSQTINVSAGFVSSAYSEYFKVYIDYNGNGVFTDAGEQVVNGAASTSATTRAYAFTVPATAKTGSTRMRVVMSDNSATTSCGAYSYGETEDYTVNITAGSGGGGGTPPPASYCASKSNSVAYEYIDYVKLGSINRTSGADGGYYNGTASSTSIAAGSSQTVSFSAGFVSTAYSEYFKVYIDYNQNGVFTDAGELVVNAAASSAATTRTGTFTVPASAKSGATRMRVVMSDNSA
ncbi:MAG: M4 family metallopeptidase, partial [Bacteroidota bacterium]|nr:M4 family metallopeptidase [Bacteroidota bacterium]